MDALNVAKVRCGAKRTNTTFTPASHVIFWAKGALYMLIAQQTHVNPMNVFGLLQTIFQCGCALIYATPSQL
jgi:cation transport ATPase